MAEQKKLVTKMLTSTFRISYPHLFAPVAYKGKGEKKYSFQALFPKEDKDGNPIDIVGTLHEDDGGARVKLSTLILNAKLNKFGSKDEFPPKEEMKVRLLRDGDGRDFIDKKTGKQKPGYAGHWVLTAKAKEDVELDIIDQDMEPITKPSLIYPGCYCRAYISVYVYEMEGYGITASFDSIQKVKDGKSFGGGKKAVGTVYAPIAAPDDDGQEADQVEEVDFM
jgi:ssDNA-binding protein